MTNYDRLNFELAEKEYFSDATKRKQIYEDVLTENFLDPYDTYSHENDRINMLESVYSILSMLSNDIQNFRKISTEFADTSAAYQYLQKRLKDIRAEIDRIKLDTHYEDEQGNVSTLTSYMFFNAGGQQ